MRARRVALLAIPVLLASGCAAPRTSAIPTIEVSGHPVPALGVTTVGQALARAAVVVPSGQVLSVVTHKPLGADDDPGSVLVDGQPATPETLVRAGAVVTVVPGADVTEPLTTVNVPVPPAGGLANLYVGGADGRSQVVEGALSGERVSQKLLEAPRIGHLVAPGAVALTFDDGPDPVWTPRILAALTRAHVHATFCLIGWRVKAHPELVRAIVKAGNTLCNHTWSHDEHLATRSVADITYQMARTQEQIRWASGLTPALFRAPGGSWSPAVETEARALGMSPLKWTVDPRDWARPGVRAILGVILARLRPGGIILLHDGGGDRSQTYVALGWLLRWLGHFGYHFVVPRPTV